MNEFNLPADDTPLLEERTFDLLVDGELPPADERRLLAQLDHTPDGWRRCALAFLEAQAWRKHLGPIVGQRDLIAGAAPDAEPVKLKLPSVAGRAIRAWGSRLALAASFLLAFSLGLALRQFGVGPTGEAPSVATGRPPAAGQVAVAAPAPEQSGGDLKRLRLRLAGSQQPAEVQWPMYEPAEFANGGGAAGESVASEKLVKALEEQGHQVNYRRDWVPVQLEDGRQGLVPVDRLDIQPIEWNTYQ
ncbi:MAG: hypothetical protein K1X74_01545 [Pirellulales bacterium]|nr:hypothetical protein [Pirellulales bacterium]